MMYQEKIVGLFQLCAKKAPWTDFTSRVLKLDLVLLRLSCFTCAKVSRAGCIVVLCCWKTCEID